MVDLMSLDPSDRAPRHLSGLADTKVEQHCHRYGHYDEYELHGSSPIGQLALNVRSEAVPAISSEINAPFHCPKPPALPTKGIAHLNTSGDCCGAGFQSGPCRLRVKLDRVGPSENLIFVCVISNCRKCHKRAAAHARAQAARTQKSIETVSQTERCNITGGEPAAALALRT